MNVVQSAQNTAEAEEELSMLPGEGDIAAGDAMSCTRFLPPSLLDHHSSEQKKEEDNSREKLLEETGPSYFFQRTAHMSYPVQTCTAATVVRFSP